MEYYDLRIRGIVPEDEECLATLSLGVSLEDMEKMYHAYVAANPNKYLELVHIKRLSEIGEVVEEVETLVFSTAPNTSNG